MIALSPAACAVGPESADSEGNPYGLMRAALQGAAAAAAVAVVVAAAAAAGRLEALLIAFGLYVVVLEEAPSQ